MRTLLLVKVFVIVFAADARRLITTKPPNSIQQNSTLGAIEGNINVTHSSQRSIFSNPLPKLISIGTFGNKKYYAGNRTQTWADSRALCEGNGLQLSRISDRDVRSFLSGALRNFMDSIKIYSTQWISGRGGAVYELKNQDDNDCPYFNSYFQYVENCCCRSYRLPRCESVDSSTSINASKLVEETTSSSKTTISATPKPESQLFELGTFENKTYYGDNIKRDWIESRAFCKSHGLQLITVTTHCHIQFLRRNGQRSFWTMAREGHDTNLEICPYFNTNYYYRHFDDCGSERFLLCETVDKIEQADNSSMNEGKLGTLKSMVLTWWPYLRVIDTDA